MDIGLAIAAKEAAETELADLLLSKRVTKIIAGAGGSGNHWEPSIGIHLAEYESHGAQEMENIRQRLIGIVPDGVNVAIFPMKQVNP